MLRIHQVTTASGAKNYYAASDYYADGQETLGAWGGTLAERMGLSGTVDKASFDRLCDNLHPATGKSLTPRTNAERRVGYDFVFSAPKSFSIVEALAGESGRQELLSAFDASIRETMEELEADMQTRVRRQGADCDRTTGNLLYASFDHSTARPVGGAVPDMHRHRHVLVFNATFDADEDRIKAGQFAAIKRDGEYFTAAFYARLANRLEGMGYRIDRSRGLKEWEIAGVPQAVIDRFSKRSEEVQEAHEEKRKNDPTYREEYKHELGAKTRSGKQKELTPAELRAAWEGQLSDADRQALAAVYGRRIAPDARVSASEAVSYAVHHCFEKASVVPERELKRVALLYGLGDVTADEVAAELPRQGIITRTKGDRLLATTKAVQREEEEIAAFATRMGPVKPVGLPDGLNRGALDDDQWRAVQGLLTSSCRVNVVNAIAGTGKTTALGIYDQAMRLAGEEVTYLASTAEAAKVLNKEGFEAVTVAHFLLDERMQERAKDGRVVIDESSLLGHRDAYRLFGLAAEKNLKLNFVGDSRQHGSVARGSLLHVLTTYGGITPFTIATIKRQKGSHYRKAVEALAAGETVSGFDQLDRLGWVKENREGDRYWHLANEYVQAINDKKTALVVSPTHAEGERITREIRRQLRLAKKLGKEERAFTRLVARNLSEAERGDARNYQGGDVLQFHQNAKQGFGKGDRLAFSGAEDARAGLPVGEAARFQVYRPETIHLAKGDLIRFTANGRSLDGKHKLTNGSSYRVAGFTEGGNIRLENGWVVGKEEGHFRHGYVETSFGSQGKTVDRVILGMAAISLPAINREQMYVSSSRARERLTLYTDDKEAVREGIQRSSAKIAALDLVGHAAHPNLFQPPHAARKASLAERMRRQADKLKRLRFYQRIRVSHDTPQPERSHVHGR
ncbi:MobF family relaxase [Planctomyces sp. SH-PL62]|uniref:MobF family relaxase n=1 Tax=Planctomyces sp. SH-PL62 TaxID=1636152 RepID=UPI00078E615C|nr:MobF family relaxase [Planctomyces sp. SH-PL62]AMV40245.1 Multifunctional conjugation protein TraI [Planctomyces sp. SH-PL62]